MMWIAFALLLLKLSLALDSLTVLQPPKITLPDRPQKLYFAERERVLVNCSAEGTPSPEYKWQRNGKVIEGDNEFIKFDSRTGMLEIPLFTDREQGVFVCRASNVIGSNVAVTFSHPQTLLASRVENFKKRDNDTPDEINSNEYTYAMMRCTDQGEVVGDPNDITYIWYITAETRPMSTDDGRLFISSDGTLHFTYTLTKDQLEGSDAYHCGISSLRSRLVRLGPPMILNVQESSPTALKPALMYSNSGQQAILANTAELECVFSGYDPTSGDKLPVINWFDDAGDPLVSDGKKYTLHNKNRILRIADVQETDDKNYSCQGTTSAGSSTVQTVYLNVTSAPIWVEAPKDTTVPEGSTVNFQCNARSLSSEETPLSPVWYINGQPFADAGKSNAVLSDDTKSMTLTNVTKANDILCVQCIVSNSIGQTMGDAILNVIAPIKLTLGCQKCQNSRSDDCTCSLWEISKGDSVEFLLAWKSDPAYTEQLTQEWTFKDNTYKIPQLPPFWNRDEVSQVYHFNTGNLSNDEFYNLAGKYYFKVFHAYDSREETITIQVKGVIPVADLHGTSAASGVSSARADTWVIYLVIGLAILIIATVLIALVIKCHPKQQEGVYDCKKETSVELHDANVQKDKVFHGLYRPDYEDNEYPEKKPKGELEYDDALTDGEDESLGEYGDERDIHFNEDGSFIGTYIVKPSSNDRTMDLTTYKFC